MSRGVAFRRAEIRKLEMVRALISDAFAPYLAAANRRHAPMDADHAARINAGDVTVADEDGRILGALVVKTIAESVSAQGRGIGARLIAVAEKVARMPCGSTPSLR